MLELKLELARREFDIDIELKVPTGNTYCLYGPSGTGKSSILSVIAGFEHSYRFARLCIDKTMFMDSSACPVVDMPTWQRRFGYMEQAANLFPHMTVKENIAYGMIHNDAKWLHSLIERLDLTPLLAAKPGKLSGGQKQRVALARALAIRPQLVLLDEPFSALDWQARISLQKAVAEWQKELGFTVLLVTHQLTEAQRLASCIGLIDNGRILQEGSPAELFSRPKSKRAAQLQGYTHFLPTANGQKFAVHPDCAILGRQPERGIVVQGCITDRYEYAGRQRLSVKLPEYQSVSIEVNLPIHDSWYIGESVDLTFINPPCFAD